MAESSALNNESGLSAADYADLQHIGSQLPQGHPIRAKIDHVLSMSQPNAGLAGPATPAIPQPKPLTERLTEVEKPDSSNRWSPMEAVKAVGNVGAGAMTPILHPVDTLAGIGGMVTAVPEMIAGRPFGSTVPGQIVHSIRDNPYGTVESGIGQSATMGGISEIPKETATAPIRGVVKAGNAVLKNPTVQKIAPYAGTAFGYAAGEGMGHPWMGAGLGGGLGRAIQKGITIPGERLGLPPEPPLYDTSVLPEQKGPLRGTPVGPPAGVGTVQPIERVTPKQTQVRAVAPKPETPPPTIAAPEPVKPPQVSIPDQIATAKGLGFRNLGDAINRFGFEGWQKILGQEAPKPAVSEPPSVRPGSPTPFRSESPLTPSDLAKVKNTRIPTWEEIEAEGRKNRFYAEMPYLKSKTQLVNEASDVQPTFVAKSEAKTAPYNRNLPTRRK